MLWKGLPISLVHTHDPVRRVDRAREGQGTLVARAGLELRLEDGALIPQCSLENPTEHAVLTATALEAAVRQLAALPRLPDALSDSLRTLAESGKRVEVDLLASHRALVEADPEQGRLLVDLEAAAALGLVVTDGSLQAPDDRVRVGAPAVFALGLAAGLHRLNGGSLRDSLHTVFALFERFETSVRRGVLATLEPPVLDAGQTLGLALRTVVNPDEAWRQDAAEIAPFVGLDTPALLEVGRLTHAEPADVAEAVRRHAGPRDDGPQAEWWASLLAGLASGDQERRREHVQTLAHAIDRTFKWRDKWATWVLGQARVDVPYDQAAVFDLLETPMEDVDAKRALVNDCIAGTYDYRAEGANIRRLTTWARENGVHLVAGRLSRAFGNQAHLLSAAAYVEDRRPMRPAVAQLQEAAAGVRSLQTQCTRIAGLVDQARAVPFAQLVGAVDQAEEALARYQIGELEKLRQRKAGATASTIDGWDRSATRSGSEALASRVDRVLKAIDAVRDLLYRAPRRDAAFVVFQQRLHPAETILLASANANREVHPGKEEDLRDLTRIGGHNLYASQGAGTIEGPQGTSESVHWISKVGDWIEAIPLFIKERVVTRRTRVGGEEVDVESIETEVDQDAMEVFFRLHAEYWARNIDEVIALDYVGLARELLVASDPELVRRVEAASTEAPGQSREEAIRRTVADVPALAGAVELVAAAVAVSADAVAPEIARAMEADGAEPRAALRAVLLADTNPTLLARAFAESAQTGAPLAETCLAVADAPERDRLQAFRTSLSGLATAPTRPYPNLHILTTESAGMTEGYVQSWLEEEMALYTVVRAHGLEAAVSERIARYRSRLEQVARHVIDELGMNVVVQEVMAEQRVDESRAIATVVASFKPVADEISRLAVLLERLVPGDEPAAGTGEVSDPPEVEAILRALGPELEALCRPQVAANNGRAFERQLGEVRRLEPGLDPDEALQRVIESEPDYLGEVQSLMRSEARKRVLEDLARQHPGLDLRARARNYIRDHTGLARSTARKEILAEHGLQHLTLDPRFAYQATGAYKRYNLLYTPSRVNLGEKERASVAVWRQWVGGADAQAARAGFDFYSLVNEGGVEERPALAYAEIQKTSENALCVTHFAGSNALGLLVNAVKEGDVEDMADQMNLRGDRLVLPAGEGYGGYCVPKDGLFLAFVLSLTNEVKLRQMGIPEHLHAGVLRLAREAIVRRRAFESDADWQRWAAAHLLEVAHLSEIFRLEGGVPVFQISKVARAVLRLGGPWPAVADGDALLANLSARWGVERMIVFAEQVNRYMVFYKAWMIYQCLAEARRFHPACPKEHEARIALTAEYKPVQDVRYSTGLRLFELFSGTGDHLYHSLDEHGQNLAYLLLNGFDPHSNHPIGRRAAREVQVTYGIETGDEALDHLRAEFPPHDPPADIVLTSVTLCSTQDMLFYVSDTRMDQLAEQVKVKLTDAGLTEKQMTADAQVHGGNLRAWSGLRSMPAAEREALVRQIGGHIHPLVLKLRGPGRDYARDVQGIDVLNTGIPFPELLALIDDMPRLVALMLHGNPNSALAIADGAAGKQRRALVERDILAFFATCDKFGRRGTYRAIGWGSDNVDRLRAEVARKRKRSRAILEAYRAVAEAPEGESLREAAREARALFRSFVSGLVADDEPGQALRTEEKLKRYKKWRPGDAFISQALSKLRAGLDAASLDAGTWLAGFGGLYEVVAEPQDAIDRTLSILRRGAGRLAALAAEGDGPSAQGALAQPFTAAEEEALIRALVRPRYVPEMQRFAQEMLVETSSKAVEVAAIEALERRKALKQRAARARAIGERSDAFDAHIGALTDRSFDDLTRDARHHLSDLDEALDGLRRTKEDEEAIELLTSKANAAFGRYLASARLALDRLATDLWTEAAGEAATHLDQFRQDVRAIFTGREVILEDWKRLAGGYEQVGGLARLAEAAKGDRLLLDRVARAVELFYTTFALGQTLEFAVRPLAAGDVSLFWKRLTDFFAETINDHWYDYLPWAYGRGVGFASLPADDLYRLAVDRHAWLYRYLRRLIVEQTELRDWPKSDVDALLGNYLDGHQTVAIGADGRDDTERAWRAYNQLREIAFLKSDGFSAPFVFPEFDPDLIAADRRTNLVFLFPVGRTHISRAFREGPTLRRWMGEAGEAEANLIVSRYEPFESTEDLSRPALRVRSGHLYLSEEEFSEALRRHRGLDGPDVDSVIAEERRQGRLTDKGIRVAARFVRNGRPAPILAGAAIPFHGLPAFESGELERAGLPATVQSLLFHEITYDKSLYPDIFTEGTGVELPAEHDWLRAYGEGLSREEQLRAIERGTADGAFRGLRAFAAEHPIVLIKGAAESGARNLKVFEIGRGAETLDEEELANAVRFVADVAKKQNVVIQEAMRTSPEFWADERLMRSFVDRQILEWNRPVFRDRYPRSQIYGSLRVVAASPHPDLPYETAFLITLNSLQVATNVGRGGTLEMLSPDVIRPEVQTEILEGLKAQAPKVMEAMAAYARTYTARFEANRGRPVGTDLRGVSYAWPPYLMLDYLVTPVFERSGRLIDIEPTYDGSGRRTGARIILEDPDGRFEGRIAGWRFVHLEPNVGIGLWDRFNLREEERERAEAEAQNRPFDWDNVGRSDRAVLRTFVLAGAQYLEALRR